MKKLKLLETVSSPRNIIERPKTSLGRTQVFNRTSFITDFNTEQLSRFTSYINNACLNRKIIMQQMNIGPLFVKQIARILNREEMCNQIASVSLPKNRIGNEGIANLVELFIKTSVIHLDVSQNNITPPGFEHLFTALETNSTLVSLEIGNLDSFNINKLGK